ncbi:MAG: ABC transporter permease subunit [Candidatus Thermoplasmatota archaeon]
MIGRPSWLIIPGGFLAFLLLWPLAAVVQQASVDGIAWLGTPYVRSRVAGALAQAFLSLLLALAVAVPLAWLHHSRRVAGRRWMLALHAAPFVMPVFVVVFGLQATVGANGWLANLGGPNLLAMPLVAVALANATYNAGFAARLGVEVLDGRPRALEEAAATLGAPPRGVWARVTGPLLAPRLVAVALLVLLFSLGSFGVVLLLGDGAIDTLETLLYANRAGAFPRPDRAAALALLQLVLNGLLVALALRLGKRTRRASQPWTAPPASRTRTAFLGAFAVLSTLPLVAVLVGGFRLRGAWSLAPWRTLLDAQAPGHLSGFSLGSALGWSLGYALLSTLLALGLTLALAYGLRPLGRLRRVAEWMAATPLATSSLTLGYGLVAAFSGGLAVLGAVWIPARSPLFVVAAHTLLAFPLASRLVVPALDAVDRRLEQAASLLGASPLRQLFRIHLPLLGPALLGAASLAAAASLGDFGASLLLSPGDALGLSVWIARHGGPGSFDPLARAQSTALAGLLMLLTLAVLALAAPRRRTT